MRKAAVIICAAIYAISIIIVTFLGYRAEVRNPPIFADEIVFSQEIPYKCVVNGAVIYTIKEAENSHISNDEDTSSSIVYKYDLNILEFEYIYKVLGGEMDVVCKPISYKTDAETGEQKQPDVLTLNYMIGNDKVASVNKDGKITFKQFKEIGHLDLIVSTSDTTNLKIYINITWDIYEN